MTLTQRSKSTLAVFCFRESIHPFSPKVSAQTHHVCNISASPRRADAPERRHFSFLPQLPGVFFFFSACWGSAYPLWWIMEDGQQEEGPCTRNRLHHSSRRRNDGWTHPCAGEREMYVLYWFPVNFDINFSSFTSYQLPYQPFAGWRLPTSLLLWAPALHHNCAVSVKTQ